MRTVGLLSSLITLAAVVLATETWSNGTHFEDLDTGNVYRHFNCDVHSGHASEHYLKAMKALYDKERASKIGTRAALPAARAKKAAKKKQPTKSATAQPATSTTAASVASTSAAAGQANIQNIPTYFHIISTAAHTGTITPAMVSAQFQEMNSAYNPYGISFSLAGTTWTVNDAWAIAAGSDMAAAQSALRQGSYSALNIYFHTDLSGGNLGTCTLPSQVPSGATMQTYISDGCDVNANTMPGGTFGGYNMGKTAVHETGHWLGLMHTFEGYSCTGSGDMVDDTRIESQSTNGCPSSPAKNSCPTVPGVDPINNYMDYSTDACYTSFSAGQVARMQALWTQFRAGK